MADKRSSYKLRQNLAFSAAQPKFLQDIYAALSGGASGGGEGPADGAAGGTDEFAAATRGSRARPAHDDETPAVVLGAGVSEVEARDVLWRARGDDGDDDNGDGDRIAGPDDSTEKEEETAAPARPVFRKTEAKDIMAAYQSDAHASTKRSSGSASGTGSTLGQKRRATSTAPATIAGDEPAAGDKSREKNEDGRKRRKKDKKKNTNLLSFDEDA